MATDYSDDDRPSPTAEVREYDTETEPESVAAFNRLLDALDAARVDTDEPDGEQRYQDAREACFAFVDAHPEVLPLARDYGLPISPGELPTHD